MLIKSFTLFYFKILTLYVVDNTQKKSNNYTTVKSSLLGIGSPRPCRALSNSGGIDTNDLGPTPSTTVLDGPRLAPWDWGAEVSTRLPASNNLPAGAQCVAASVDEAGILHILLSGSCCWRSGGWAVLTNIAHHYNAHSMPASAYPQCPNLLPCRNIVPMKDLVTWVTTWWWCRKTSASKDTVGQSELHID